MKAARWPLPAVALAATLGLTLSGCSGATTPVIVVSGTVDATLTTVTAPTLTPTSLNLDAGFADLTGTRDPVSGRTATRRSPVAGALGFGSTVRVSEVSVVEGDRVRAGQVLVNLDARAQAAQLAGAKADAAVAAAQVGLLDDAIATTFDKEADVNDARDKVRDGIAKIHSGQKKLRAAAAGLRATRADLVTRLRAAEELLAHYPPVPIDPPKEALPGIIAGLRDGIAKIDAGLRTLHRLRAKLARGLRQAAAGLRKLDDALARIGDARGNLRGLRRLAELQATALRVPIDTARAQQRMTTLTAPVDGVVVSVAPVGAQLAPGATVVSIRQAQPSRLTAWLSPSQLRRVCTGDPARVVGDWMTGDGVPATLTSISRSAEYPPTSVSTEEVHLTRAVEVEFTAAEQLPAGVPVEVIIQGCHPAADQPEPDR